MAESSAAKPSRKPASNTTRKIAKTPARIPATDSESNTSAAGPIKGQFVAPPAESASAPIEALPKQGDFWLPPVRFGSIPVESEPLGWNRKQGLERERGLVSRSINLVVAAAALNIS